MPKLVAELDGTRFYQQHSTMAPTDGDGTYEAHRPPFYFEHARAFTPNAVCTPFRRSRACGG